MEFLIVALFAVLVVATQPLELEDDRVNLTQNYIPNGNRRVIDGKQATTSQFPYQAGILFTQVGEVNPNKKELGGGSLISSTRVLTAAHCVKDASSALVILGAIYLLVQEPSQVRINVPASGFVIHPQYNPQKHKNDIAIIKLPSAVKFNNYISPIALPENSIYNYVGVTGVISGWGEFDKTKDQSQFLRFANVQIITNTACFRVFSDTIIDSTICAQGAGDVSGCRGDSGGPLAIQSNGKPILIGVISFTAELGCIFKLPTGCARVTSFLPWIKSNML